MSLSDSAEVFYFAKGIAGFQKQGYVSGTSCVLGYGGELSKA